MEAQPQVITVSGAATRPVAADRATLLLLAEGTGATVGQALRAHAEAVQRVVQALIGCGAPRGGIHGAAPRILEAEEPGLRGNAQRAVTASRATGPIRIVLDDLTGLASIVDAALLADATFDSIVFGLRNEREAREQVLAAALADAHMTGSAIASAFGKVLSEALGVAEEAVSFDGGGEYSARVRVTFVLLNA